jgi:hypothetical protein
LPTGDNSKTTDIAQIMVALEDFPQWPELSKTIDMLKSTIEYNDLNILNDAPSRAVNSPPVPLTLSINLS